MRWDIEEPVDRAVELAGARMNRFVPRTTVQRRRHHGATTMTLLAGHG